MNTLKTWLSAARLRTLPLSVSGIIVGIALANHAGYHNPFIVLFCLLVTIGFQVTSNFANDYGDGTKGTDNADRVGPVRALQSGALTASALKKGIVISASISMLLSIILLSYTFGITRFPLFLLFMVLGLLSVWAAIKYTVGSNPYGYIGLGDVFVFLFFGLLSVLGTKFLLAEHLTPWDMLPAIAIGLLCIGVLNLNNLRDVHSDKKHGKNTLIVKMGFKNGKRYHGVLLLLSMLSFVIYSMSQMPSLIANAYLLVYVPVFFHLRKVIRTKTPSDLDPELKKLAISTFLLSLGFYFSINYFL